ncbi:hypothetical protein ZYGR_0AD01230 [Zygosaccharomyces rouxii]|uniref:Heat shock transcription factor n=2 Tax=Zygosaccharomyces rouxii TaxID=4956 RepID=C5E007_ZYGRC|nr:uncharacterized protein ZYRO0G08734g [Zygosaccharomyces rouxii]KAH9202435.1 HSF-type DNA-binding-domain-containing protein [Zygosaccharomyces rouxii]GAV50940.1 hypothetical protein ZYGR_0AD01230 [Zygosaccharomyces rouxii]CAR29441.1 ZYRO0G08734p [Zygosaccharomyces rouxii]
MDRGSNKDSDVSPFNDDEIEQILHPNNLFTDDLRQLDKDSNSGAIEDIINPSLDQNAANNSHNNNEAIENAIQRVSPVRMNNQLLPTRMFRPPVTAAQASTPKPTTHKKRHLFVNKVWSMLNDESNGNLIRWAEDGKSFVVVNREEFVHQVLPKYFKHSNFASFVRQLNMYGWHKVQDVKSGSIQNSSDDKWQFENEFFIRGREDLLQHIVRQRPANQARLSGPTDPGSGTANGNGEMHLSEYHLGDNVNFAALLNELEQIKYSQLAISKDLLRINKDNELLWKENMLARERHRTQQQALEKILRFLASLVPHMDQKMIAENIFQDVHNGNGNQTDMPGSSASAAAAAGVPSSANLGVPSPGINGPFAPYDNEFQDFPNFNDGILPLDNRYLLRNGSPNDSNSNYNSNLNHYDSNDVSTGRISEIPFDEEEEPSRSVGSNRSSFLSHLQSNMEEQDARIQQLEDMVTSQANPNSSPNQNQNSSLPPQASTTSGLTPLLQPEDNLMSLQENSPGVVVQDLSSHTNTNNNSTSSSTTRPQDADPAYSSAGKRVAHDDDHEDSLIEEIDTKKPRH